MGSARAALISIFSFCFIGIFCFAAVAAAQQEQTSPTITAPPQTTPPRQGAFPPASDRARSWLQCLAPGERSPTAPPLMRLKRRLIF